MNFEMKMKMKKKENNAQIELLIGFTVMVCRVMSYRTYKGLTM